LVCLEHLRAFLFVGFSELPSTVRPGLFLKAFYLVTSLGHEAVLLFFVLSGFLVGGSVLKSLNHGTWSWSGYMVRRMSRLWVVLLPALVLTAFWDGIGSSLHADGYAGIWRSLYHSGPSLLEPCNDTLPVFLGNAGFLQTILVPCYGTNSPLWSLANEFWYYLLFPLFLIFFRSGKFPKRILCGLLAALILGLLPRSFPLGLLIWSLGAWAFHLSGREWLRRVLDHGISRITAIVLIAGSLAISRRVAGSGSSDLLVGIPFVLLVLVFSRGRHPSPYVGDVFSAFSEFSYTLYLVHFPVLAWLFFTGFHGHRILPDQLGFLVFAAILAGVILYAAAVWWCFERNTDRVRRFLLSFIPGTQRC